MRIWTVLRGGKMGFVICRIFHHITWYPNLKTLDLDGVEGTYGKCTCGKEYFCTEETNIVILIENQKI